MTKLGSKRSSQVNDSSAVQKANEQWWTDYTMSYDWNDKVQVEKYTNEWFDEIDKRFVHGARVFAHDQAPFDRLIPFAELQGKRVLEIGCGMGYHSELLVRSGALLTAIDISETSIQATRQRFAERGLVGTIEKWMQPVSYFLMNPLILSGPGELFIIRRTRAASSGKLIVSLFLGAKHASWFTTSMACRLTLRW